MRRTLCSLIATVVAACGEQAAPTFDDVAPILAARCLGCHTADGVAPFSLEDHAAIAAHAAAIKDAVVTRYMPPIHIDDSGECQDFVDRGTLTDDEIATIAAWVDAGALPGTSSAPLVAPTTAATSVRADHVLDVGADFTPDPTISDHYRCFTVAAGFDRTRYITALGFAPSDVRITHHISLFVLRSDGAKQWALHRDEEDPGTGFDCFSGDGWPEMHFPAGWSPGMPPIHYPAELGFEVEAADVFMIQVHYNLARGAFPARSTIALTLADQVERPGYVVGIADLAMRLPPGRASVDTSADVTWTGGDARIYGVMPHMHRRGRSLRLRNFGLDGGACLARQTLWDYRWHQLHLYEQAVPVRANSRFEITCNFDTSDDTEVVTWGDGSDDEMCATYMLVADE